MMIILWETEAQARRAAVRVRRRVPEGARQRRRDLHRHPQSDLGLGSQRAIVCSPMPKLATRLDGDVAEIVISNPPLNLWGPQLITDSRTAWRARAPNGRAP